MTKIHWFTFLLISIVFIINPQSLPGSTTADVKYDGKRISVHAKGVPLKQLLSTVEKQTGIQFSYDDLLAETNVYAIFDNNSLADGLRRILLQFNYAVIYTGSGHIKAVLVLNRNRQRASSKSPGNQTELHPHTSLQDQTELHASLQETDISDISDSAELPPLFEPLSEQLSEMGPNGQDIPPGVDENVTPPPGEEALSPVVDSNVSSPPGAEPLSPVVDPDVSPPPGEEALETDNVSTLSPDTEKQAAPQAN